MSRRQTLAVLTAALLSVCYAPTLQGMFDQWLTEEDMSHGLVVPILIFWVIWRERDRWRALRSEPSGWGIALLAAGAGLHFAGVLGVGLFASSVALLISIAGAVLCLGGFGVLRRLAFPFALAAFMLPKLAFVYDQATLPLQLIASRIAAGLLTLSGIGAIREGNILDVGGHRVAVAEACNGIRYLFALGLMAVVFAYVADSKPWMRWALLAAAVPIAILANAVRVAAASWLPFLDGGFPHAACGWFIFVLCLAPLMLLRGLFNKVYVSCQSRA